MYLFNKGIERKQLLRIILILISTTIVGCVLYKFIVDTFFHKTYEIPLFYCKEWIITSFKNMFTQYYEMIFSFSVMGIIMLLSIVSFCISVYNSCLFLFSRSKSNPNIIYNIYSIFFSLFYILTFIAPAAAGIYGEPGSIRYNIVILFMSLINYGLYFYNNSYSLFNRKNVKKLLISIIAIECIFVTKETVKINPFLFVSRLNSYYPSFIKATDSLSKTYGVKNGIGDYWDASYVNTLSKNNVVIKSVFSTLWPNIYYCNFNDYYYTDYTKKKKRIYQFISSRNFNDTSAISKIFGVNSVKKVTVNGYNYYLVPDFTINEKTNEIELIKK